MKKLIYTLSFFFIFSFSSLFARTLKIGVLAPEGTAWSSNLKKLAKEVKEKTNGKVKFKIYYGGAMGDEPDVLRKVRVRQLHGGVFTGKTLGDINGDIRVMEIPFTFYHDRAKAWNTLKDLSSYFNKRFEEKGFINLGFFEIGLVYFVSQKKSDSLDKLTGLKIWAWQGDELVSTLVESMNLVSIPLPITDVLSSLSTGIVEAAYAPPLGIVALQWSTKIKYLVDFPLAYSVGAFLIDKKQWMKIDEKSRKIIMEIGQRNISKVNEANVQDNRAALEAMKGIGVEFIKFPKDDIEKAQSYRKVIVEKLTGKLFSKDALNKLELAIAPVKEVTKKVAKKKVAKKKVAKKKVAKKSNKK